MLQRRNHCSLLNRFGNTPMKAARSAKFAFVLLWNGSNKGPL
jgi:hypothetical protein